MLEEGANGRGLPSQQQAIRALKSKISEAAISKSLVSGGTRQDTQEKGAVRSQDPGAGKKRAEFHIDARGCRIAPVQGYQTKEIHVDVRKIMHKHKENVLDKLTQSEQKRLQELRQEELQKYRHAVDERFDTAKNWSIMINPKDNEIRNQVMRSTKFQQLKRRCLHDFMRTTKDEIIRERQEKAKKEGAQKLGEEIGELEQLSQMNILLPVSAGQQAQLSNAREAMAKARQEKQEKLVKEQVSEYKTDFLKYFEMKLTK